MMFFSCASTAAFALLLLSTAFAVPVPEEHTGLSKRADYTLDELKGAYQGIWWDDAFKQCSQSQIKHHGRGHKNGS